MEESIRVDIPKEVHKDVKRYAVEQDFTIKEAYKELVKRGLKSK